MVAMILLVVGVAVVVLAGQWAVRKSNRRYNEMGVDDKDRWGDVPPPGS